jgi:hypothetical protein
MELQALKKLPLSFKNTRDIRLKNEEIKNFVIKCRGELVYWQAYNFCFKNKLLTNGKTERNEPEWKVFREDKFKPISILPFTLTAKSKFTILGEEIASDSSDVRPNTAMHGDLKYQPRLDKGKFKMEVIKKFPIIPIKYRSTVETEHIVSKEMIVQCNSAGNRIVGEDYKVVQERIKRNVMKDSTINMPKDSVLTKDDVANNSYLFACANHLYLERKDKVAIDLVTDMSANAVENKVALNGVSRAPNSSHLNLQVSKSKRA